MLYLVHRVAISIKLKPVKLEQAVSESLPHKGLYTELLGVQLTCLDPVPASIRARNAQEINITNCDVTTWSWVNLVHPLQYMYAIKNWRRERPGNEASLDPRPFRRVWVQTRYRTVSGCADYLSWSVSL